MSPRTKFHCMRATKVVRSERLIVTVSIYRNEKICSVVNDNKGNFNSTKTRMLSNNLKETKSLLAPWDELGYYVSASKLLSICHLLKVATNKFKLLQTAHLNEIWNRGKNLGIGSLFWLFFFWSHFKLTPLSPLQIVHMIAFI